MTVHDLAADWSWMEHAVGFKIPGSGHIWEEAVYGPRGGLMIRRLDHLRETARYVSPTQQVTLVAKEAKHV